MFFIYLIIYLLWFVATCKTLAKIFLWDCCRGSEKIKAKGLGDNDAIKAIPSTDFLFGFTKTIFSTNVFIVVSLYLSYCLLSMI